MTTTTSSGTVSLSGRELDVLGRYGRAANYLSVGQIYLPDNPLLREPLVQHEMVEGRDDAGLDTCGDTGEGDPVRGIEDLLVAFPTERIVLFTCPVPERRYDEGHRRRRVAVSVWLAGRASRVRAQSR